MTLYILTKDAENDLREIARYTLRNHGAKQLQLYRGKIKEKLKNIANDKMIEHPFSEIHPQVHVTKCEHHFIFYITENHEKPIIIGIIHENRDVVSHIKNRI